MKVRIAKISELIKEERWDIDYHLPPEGIAKFPDVLVKEVCNVADIIRTKRDPTKTPDDPFLYVDIASVDVTTGSIENPHELVGSEAPSRARKVIHAYDIIISTCRPTRGAIAIVPENLHGQICSTGFSVIRAKKGINPFYLHFALRLASTLEQFRKFSTGSSYPAILDEDVEKTKIPIPPPDIQDEISLALAEAAEKRLATIRQANDEWTALNCSVFEGLKQNKIELEHSNTTCKALTINSITKRMEQLTPQNSGKDAERSLFADEED